MFSESMPYLNVITKLTAVIIGFHDPMKFRRDLLLADGRACAPAKEVLYIEWQEILPRPWC